MILAIGRALGITAAMIACVLLKRHGWLGDAPLSLVLVLLGLCLLLRVRRVDRALSGGDPQRRLWSRMGFNYLAVVTPTIYLTGWGPVATAAYVITSSIYLARCGSGAWRPAALYTALGITLGQGALLAGLVTSYMSQTVSLVVGVLALLGSTRATVQLGRSVEQHERDERDLRESRQQARRNETWFRTLVRNIGDVITVVAQDGVILYASPSARRHFGYDSDELIGSKSEAIVDPRDSAAARELWARLMLEPEVDHRAEMRLIGKDGTSNWHEITARNMLADPDIAGVVFNHHDVHERRTLQEGLAYEAAHDPLTGLANRAELYRLLGEALVVRDAGTAAGADPPTDVAVLFIDLDGFKPINDVHGHDAGDALLIYVARLFERCVLGADIVARVGGDEFVILLREIRQPQDAQSVAQRILDHLRAPVPLPGCGEVRVGASIGIAVASPATSPADLIRQADQAMYKAKRDGRNRLTGR